MTWGHSEKTAVRRPRERPRQAPALPTPGPRTSSPRAVRKFISVRLPGLWGFVTAPADSPRVPGLGSRGPHACPGGYVPSSTRHLPWPPVPPQGATPRGLGGLYFSTLEAHDVNTGAARLPS